MTDNRKQDQFEEVGFVKDAHGIRGELFLRFHTEQPAWMDKFKVLTLKKGEGEFLELQIRRLKPHKNGYIVRTEEIKNRNQSEELKGFKIYIDKEWITTHEKGENFFLGEVIGFEVHHKELGAVGKVSKFHFNGAQDLLVVEGENEFEVPFIEEFILDTDFENSVIHMDFPKELVTGDF